MHHWEIGLATSLLFDGYLNVKIAIPSHKAETDLEGIEYSRDLGDGHAKGRELDVNLRRVHKGNIDSLDAWGS